LLFTYFHRRPLRHILSKHVRGQNRQEKEEEIFLILSLILRKNARIWFSTYIRFAFVILPRFRKSLDECESLRDKRKPRQLKGKFFEMLFSLAEISNLSDMGYYEYLSRMMGKADKKAQLEYAREEGRKETAKSMLKEKFDLAVIARITKLPKEEILALR
jgi:hypothetical protein